MCRRLLVILPLLLLLSLPAGLPGIGAARA
jgi:hypothetical protein